MPGRERRLRLDSRHGHRTRCPPGQAIHASDIPEVGDVFF